MCRLDYTALGRDIGTLCKCCAKRCFTPKRPQSYNFAPTLPSKAPFFLLFAVSCATIVLGWVRYSRFLANFVAYCKSIICIMKKYVSRLPIVGKTFLRTDYVVLALHVEKNLLREIRPGQFVQLKAEHTSSVLLRRPISIHFVDVEREQMWLLIHIIGEGTEALAKCEIGQTLDCLFPLGNGFTMPAQAGRQMLLIGGGVGLAPMLGYGAALAAQGHTVTFLLGGRRDVDILQYDEFCKYGEVCITTEDGSMGERGFVTQHTVLAQRRFDHIAACGPKPMMVAVARYAAAHDIDCEVSLENMMACGLGACLCCVEHTVKGNVCVCTEGPVFNIKQLNWQL